MTSRRMRQRSCRHCRRRSITAERAGSNARRLAKECRISGAEAQCCPMSSPSPRTGGDGLGGGEKSHGQPATRPASASGAAQAARTTKPKMRPATPQCQPFPIIRWRVLSSAPAWAV